MPRRRHDVISEICEQVALLLAMGGRHAEYAGDELIAELRAANFMIYEDHEVLVFLNRYPTLLGYTLVCSRRHVERVVGDLGEEANLRLQQWVYRVGQAVQQVVPTERLYVPSLGSQQGNRHVHWHVAPLPTDVAYPRCVASAARADVAPGPADPRLPGSPWEFR